MNYSILIRVTVVMALSFTLFGAGPALAAKNKPRTKCHMTFNLKGWSVFYKSAKGRGVISCNNGQRQSVRLRVHGGGITFGKSEIEKGHGSFSKVDKISELFGGYAQSEAHAGAGKSAGAQAMTKGKISLTLSGTGRGVDLGFAFGKLKITPVY